MLWPMTGLARAVRLRCPNCGQGRVLASWFRIRERCPACRLRFERDEDSDYWLGAYTLNFIVTELVFAAGLLVAVLLTWPNPPWAAILWGGAAQMILTPIVFYPFSKALWLAIDLVFRPPNPEDFVVSSSDTGR
jgi:uncharacterized protein (DUF983 family)